MKANADTSDLSHSLLTLFEFKVHLKYKLEYFTHTHYLQKL